jgi:SAM-dependent methyltransferase
MAKFYDDDLALIHDEGFTTLARDAAEHLLLALEHQGYRAGVVVDLGCGSGALSTTLASRGYDIVGIDVSQSMLRLAKKRVPRGTFCEGDVFRTKLPQCVAVCAIGEVLNYRPAKRTSGRRKLRPLLDRVYRSLAPGGIFLFDVASPGRGGETGQYKSFVLRDNWAVLVEVTEDRESSWLRRDITSFRRRGKSYQRDGEVHHLELYSGDDVAAELASAGFITERLTAYGSTAVPPGWSFFRARKPN